LTKVICLERRPDTQKKQPGNGINVLIFAPKVLRLDEQGVLSHFNIDHNQGDRKRKGKSLRRE